jgi:hypothetical protein
VRRLPRPGNRRLCLIGIERRHLVTDYYLGIQVGVTIAFALLVIMVVLMSHVIRPGQLGLVFLLGTYMTAVEPGFCITSPIAKLRRVTPGSGPNRSLGMIATAEAELGPDLPAGPARIGDRVVAARGSTRIPSGSRVRVIEDIDPSSVLVAIERPRYNPPPKRQSHWLTVQHPTANLDT